MKKNFLFILIVLTLTQLAALPVQALEIVIQPNGSTYIYESKVLGDDAEEESQPRETEVKAEQEKKKIEEKRNLEPLRVIPNSSKNQIRIKTEKKDAQVILEKEAIIKKKVEEKRVTNNDTEDSLNSERIHLEMPAELKAQERRAEVLKKTQEQTENEATDDTKASPTPETEDHGNVQRTPQEIREDRRARIEEKIEIRTEQNEAGEQEFEFESRAIKAKAKGVDFIVDPETNNVTVVTPSGEQHVLTHLPDQAVIQFQASGLLDTTALSQGTEQLEIETKEDGRVVYKTKIQKPKKIFGLIKREVETEVELDDQTGLVSEEEVTSDSFFGRLLDSMAR